MPRGPISWMGYITFEYSYVTVGKRERQQEMQTEGVKEERERGGEGEPKLWNEVEFIMSERP